MSISSSRRPWPVAFLLAFAFVVLCEGLVSYFDTEFMKDSDNGPFVKELIRLAQTPGPGYQYVVFGDSFLQTGAMPEIITRETGLTGFNFAPNYHFSAFANVLLLEDYLAVHHPAPRYVVVGYKFQSCRMTKADFYGSFFFKLSYFKMHHFGEIVREFGLVPALKLFVPTLRHQQEILRIDPAALWAKILKKQQYEMTVQHYVRDTRGAFLLWRDIVNIPPPNASEVEPLKVSEYFLRNLFKFLSLCRDNGIRVIYVVPAEPPSWQRLMEKVNGPGDYDRFLTFVTKRYPNVTVVRSADILNEDRLFFNEGHVNNRGAKVLSLRIAEVIAALQKTPAP